MMKSANIIGAGKLGKVFAKLCHQQDILCIQGVVNQHPDSAQRAVEFIGAGQACATLSELQHADITLITVPDDYIAPVASELALLSTFQTGDIIVHCSGALSSDSLQALSIHPVRLVSMHPPFSFADPVYALQHFPGTSCVLEGDDSACRELEALLKPLALQCSIVSAENKILYHAALVFVNNYIVTLMDMGIRLLTQMNMTEDAAKQLIQPLIRGAIDQAFALSPAQALTGPIERGETQLLAKQLQALLSHDTDIAELYRLLGEQTIALAQRKHQWSDEKMSALRDVLLSNK